MNWYRKIQAATLPINTLNKAIEGTFLNMVPGIKKIKHLPEKANSGKIGQISWGAFYAANGYPVFYRVDLHTEIDRNVRSFENESATDGVRFALNIVIDIEWSYDMFKKKPELLSKFSKLKKIVESMNSESTGSYPDTIYEQEVESVYSAALEINRVISLIDNLLDGSEGGDDDGDEYEPWFPGDPSAEWEFEQENGDLSPVLVPNNYNKQDTIY